MNPIQAIAEEAMQGNKSQDSNPIKALAQKYVTPDDVVTAREELGDQSYNGYCERFVEEKAYGKSGIHGSAADAWNHNVKEGNAFSGLDGAQPGDLVYFEPDASNGYAGHAAIYSGGNRMISATYSGVQDSNIDDWTKQTKQKVLGYVKVNKN